MSTATFTPSIDPTTFISIYNSLSGILKEIPFIGNLFKGATQHIDYETCVTKSNEVAAASMKFYRALDQEGKNLFAQKARDYYMGYVLPGFGTWWDGAVQKDFDSWSFKGWTSPQEEVTYHYLAQPVFYFMFYEDATRVTEMFPSRYTDKLNVILWKPLSEYAQNKFGSTLQEVVDTNIKNQETPPRSYLWALGVLAALGFGYYIYKHKG